MLIFWRYVGIAQLLLVVIVRVCIYGRREGESNQLLWVVIVRVCIYGRREGELNRGWGEQMDVGRLMSVYRRL